MSDLAAMDQWMNDALNVNVDRSGQARGGDPDSAAQSDQAANAATSVTDDAQAIAGDVAQGLGGGAGADPGAAAATDAGQGGAAAAGNSGDEALAAVDDVIYFAHDSDQLTDADKSMIAAYASAYLQSQSSDLIGLDAYASVEGPADHNLDLSARRGAAVQRELVANGIPVASTAVNKHGETDAFSASDLRENRRVVLPPLPTIQGPFGVLPDLPRDKLDPDRDDPNTVFAGQHFRMKTLEAVGFGEGAGLTTFTFFLWDVDNNRAATYEYVALVITVGTPVTFTGEGDFSDLFTTNEPAQVDQFSGPAQHAEVSALSLGVLGMVFAHGSRVDVPTGFSAGGGFDSGKGSMSLVGGSVQVFNGP